MDRLCVLWNANLSKCAFIRVFNNSEQCDECLSLVAARECVVCFRISPRLLHTPTCIRLPLVSGIIRCCDMGVLKLFLHHHRRRTYLEGVGFGLPAADDSGYCAGLPRALFGGTHRDGHLRRPRGVCQPCADDLLLPVHYCADDHCLPN